MQNMFKGRTVTSLCSPQVQNIQNCKENLKQNQRDLELVKDSITTTEVLILQQIECVIRPNSLLVPCEPKCLLTHG